jgi:hypothetical protein
MKSTMSRGTCDQTIRLGRISIGGVENEITAKITVSGWLASYVKVRFVGNGFYIHMCVCLKVLASAHMLK